MRGKGDEKAPMHCCTGADMLLFAFLINWRNLIQYEYHSKTDKRKRIFFTQKNWKRARKSVSLQKRNVSPINIYKVWKR